MKSVLMWDLPTRLFHWALVLSVFAAIVSGLIGGNLMALHVKAGLSVVALIAFRLVWGFVGSTYARFAHFFPTPARVLNYLKGNWNGAGHNPLGAFSVFALLALCAFQALSGLFTTDEIMLKAPLFSLVDLETSLSITSLHKQVAWGLMAFIGLHLAAILFYKFVKKDNLIVPMLTGKKSLMNAEDYKPAPLWAWGGAVLVVLLALYFASGLWIATPPPPASPPPAPSW